MELFQLIRLATELSQDAFCERCPSSVLMDLASVAATREVSLAETSQDLLPLRRGLFELAAEVGEELVIGRGPDSDLRVDHSGVSMRHAGIERRPGGTWVVRDLRSTNGTTINGTRLLARFPMPLTAGAELGIGPGVRLTLLDPARLYETIRPLGMDLLGPPPPGPGGPPLAAGSSGRFLLRCDPFPPVELPDLGAVTVGRSPDNALILPHGSVSRHHLVVEREGPRVRVRDLGSANGTYLGWERIRGEAPLEAGGTPIILGPFELRLVVVAEGPEPGPAALQADTTLLRAMELQGTLETMPLRQLLQSIEFNARTGMIRVEAPDGREGEVAFLEGVPLRAVYGPLRGRAALLELVELERGAFWFDPREPSAEGGDPDVGRSFTEVLLEASRRCDETRRLSRGPLT